MAEYTIEEEIRFSLETYIRDASILNSIMQMNGWLDGEEVVPSRAAHLHGVSADDVKSHDPIKYRAVVDVANFALDEALDSLSANLPFGHEEIPIYLREILELTNLENFSVAALLNACAMHGNDLPFTSVVRKHHKWLVSDKEQELVDIADKILPDIVGLANRFGILHSFSGHKEFNGPFANLTQIEASQVVNACPDLSTATYPFIFARRPRNDSDIVRRLNRVLMFLHPTPLPLEIALQQISRGMNVDVVPKDVEGNILPHAILSGFVEECEYFQLVGTGIVSADPKAVDTVLAPNEARVVEALIDSPNGVSIDELEDFSKKCRVSVNEVERALVSSPLIVSMDSMTYRIIDSSFLHQILPGKPEDVNFPRALWGWDRGVDVQVKDVRLSDSDNLVSSPTLSAIRATVDRELEKSNFTDLRKLAADDLIPVIAGPLTNSIVSRLENSGQKWSPVLESETERCVGLVATKRLRNKLEGGIAWIESNDYKLKGVEVPRVAKRDDIMSIFGEGNICVFFNDSPGVWGVVFQRDLY